MEGTRADLRRWADARRAGEEHERAAIRGKPLPPSEARARGFELIDFAAALTGWPVPEDQVSRRHDEEAWRAWARLRARLAPAGPLRRARGGSR